MRWEKRQTAGKRQAADDWKADGSGRLHEWLAAMRPPLLRYCLRLTGSRWEAEDLVQDAMVRLLQSAERPEREIGFRYVCRTARNLWIDRCRRSNRVKVMARTDAAELAADGDGEEAGGRGSAKRREGRAFAAGSAHATMDVRENLEELAWRLSPKPFVILLLMDVFDFTAKETAAWLGGTEVSVQVALSRARRRLQSLSRSGRVDPHAGSNQAGFIDAGREPVPTAFFEAVLDAFRRRHPEAIREAYMTLVASGGQLQTIRAQGGKLYLTFQDLDGNVLMVST